MILDLLTAALFIAFLYFFGLRRSRQIGTEEAYLMANRKTSVFALTATLVMTELNTATLIAFSSMGYLVGPWALTLPLVFLIGLLFYAGVVAKKWKGFNGLSVASFFSERYGRDIGIMASLALLLSMTGFSAAYVKSLYLLFTPFFPALNPWLLSALLIGAVLLMMLRGGLFSIIRTDVFTFCVALIFFPLLALFSWGETPAPLPDAVVALPPRFVVSLIILTMFTYILAPWYGQKIFAARSEKTAKVSVALAAVIVFFIYSLAVLSTWLFRERMGSLPSTEHALPAVIATCLPGGLRGLGFALLFAASATTLSGVWSAMSAMVVGDFFPTTKSEGYKRPLTLTMGFALSSFILANILVDRVFAKMILANIPIAALSFALLAGFYWKRASRAGAYASILTGWIVGIGSYLFWGESGGYTWYWAIMGIPAIFFSGICGSLFFSNAECVKNR